MAVSYKKYFYLMADRNISNSNLASVAGISFNILLDKKWQLYIIGNHRKICHALKCDVDDVVELIFDDETC